MNTSSTNLSAGIVRQRRCRSMAGAVLAALALSAAAADDLTDLSLEQLLDVPVVGASKYEQKQSQVAAAVSVITRQEIRAYGWRTLDEAMASLPGVFATYDRQYTYLGTRGFGVPGDLNTRMLVTINGNRLNDPSFDAGPFGHQFPLDVDLIERIEFIPGPGGAVYGQNAMFGVINVITRTGADLGGAELSGSYQTPQVLRQGRASYGRVLDNGLDMLVSVTGMRSRGEDRQFDFGAAGVSGVAAGMDGERAQQVFTRLARGAWAFDFVHADRRKDDPTGMDKSDPLVRGQYQGDRYELAQLQYQDDYAGDTVHVLGRVFAGQEDHSEVLNFGSLRSFPARSDWTGAELRVLYTGFAAHKLMVGVEGQDNIRQDQLVLDIANPARNVSIPGSGYRIGAYLQDEWRVTDKLAATLGLRVDRADMSGNSSSPRMALVWTPTPGTALKAMFGRASRAPTVGERDYADGVSQVANPALRNEIVDTLEVVADHRVGADLTVRVSAYEWTMHHLVTLGIDPVTGLAQFQSGDVVKSHGAELSADKTWNAGVRLRGSMSFPSTTYERGGRLANSSRMLARLNLSAPLPVADLRLGYEFRYDSPRLAVDGSRVGGHTVSNLNLTTQSLARGVEVSVGIYNLFDRRYAHPGSDNNWQTALEQDGRSARVKATVRF